jgi:hypothetical protein
VAAQVVASRAVLSSIELVSLNSLDRALYTIYSRGFEFTACGNISINYLMDSPTKTT